jgi:uncharacterized membrane-anchored protein YitT (DUF2179 family)
MSLKNNKVIPFVILFFAAVLLAFNYRLFIVPNSFAPAGINGIATMIQAKFGFSIAYMSLLINVPLCIFAYFFVNKSYAVHSLCFSLSYSAAYKLLQSLDALDRFVYDADGNDVIFPVIISGVLGGLVYAICARENGSTGGTDIVAKYINRKNPLFNFFYVTFAINAVVAFSSYFVYTDIDALTGEIIYNYKPVCMCMMYCFISSFIGNKLISGLQNAYQFTVVTTHADEIDEEIVKTLHHSATRLKGLGAYNNTERDVIMCVVNKAQLYDFRRILEKYDNTFAFVQTTHTTIGNFKRIK